MLAYPAVCILRLMLNPEHHCMVHTTQCAPCSQVVAMIPPTPAAAAKYQAWAASGRAGRQYLGAELDNNVVFTCLKAGTG